MKKATLPAQPRYAPLTPMQCEAVLSRLSEKDRASLDRQVLASETKIGAAHAERWRRLACALMAHASAPAKIGGAHTIQFFIPDGKYRKQVFALHGLADGAIAVYVPDVLDEAVRAGLLSRRPTSGNLYPLRQPGETLAIDTLDGKTPNPDAFFKDMTGWNRKAIRITLPASASEEQIQAVEQICALAAEAWATPPQ